jgi:hypothetical protein
MKHTPTVQFQTFSRHFLKEKNPPILDTLGAWRTYIELIYLIYANAYFYEAYPRHLVELGLVIGIFLGHNRLRS